MSQAVLYVFVIGVVWAAVLSVGLRTSWGDLRQAFKQPGLLLRGLLVVELAVPLLTLAIVKLLPVDAPAAGVLLIAAVCPGAPFLVGNVARMGGTREVALALLMVVAFLAPFIAPAWMWALGRFFDVQVSIAPLAVVGVFARSVFIPLAIGLVVRAAAPTFAERAALWIDRAFIVGVLVLAVSLLFIGLPQLLRSEPWSIVAAALVVLGSAALGHAAGGPLLPDRMAFAIAAVLGNPGLVLLALAGIFDKADAAAAISALLIMRLLALAPYKLWVNRLSSRNQGGPSGGVPRLQPATP
jgi:BASS family bile acid:Na+ symporter